jgi:beta-ureidopropionase / N-carbamoyl-L-amino-acid hydrolase
MQASALSAAVRRREPLAAKLFQELERHTHDGIGITRASYGPGEDYAHRLMTETARGLGFEVTVDAAGNSYMTLPGRDRAAPRIIAGSHLDSVAQGGNYDGAAGVVSGLVAAASLNDMGRTLERDFTVMGIRAEESAWFGVSYIGSRSALGTLPEGALDKARRADTGRSLADHMAEAGCAPERLRREPPFLRPSDLHAYLEVHIEQGPVLDEKAIPVGIVTGIRGNFRLPGAKCRGEYSHCGGVPRSHRRDTAMAVAELIQRLDGLWTQAEQSGHDLAVTVGKLFTDAGRHAMTIIPGEVQFSLDMRSLDGAYLNAREADLRAIVADIETRRGVTFDLGAFTHAAPGILDPAIKASLADGVGRLAIPALDIPSGASHDAAAFAAAGVPTAMIFIRNANGSHNPDEAMAMPDFMRATELLTWWLAEGAPS